MNDQIRTAIILALQNTLAVGVAFGLSLTAEQSVGIIAAFNSTLAVVMLFWKDGQESEHSNPP